MAATAVWIARLSGNPIVPIGWWAICFCYLWCFAGLLALKLLLLFFFSSFFFLLFFLRGLGGGCYFNFGDLTVR